MTRLTITLLIIFCVLGIGYGQNDTEARSTLESIKSTSDYLDYMMNESAYAVEKKEVSENSDQWELYNLSTRTKGEIFEVSPCHSCSRTLTKLLEIREKEIMEYDFIFLDGKGLLSSEIEASMDSIITALQSNENFDSLKLKYDPDPKAMNLEEARNQLNSEEAIRQINLSGQNKYFKLRFVKDYRYFVGRKKPTNLTKRSATILLIEIEKTSLNFSQDSSAKKNTPKYPYGVTGRPSGTIRPIEKTIFPDDIHQFPILFQDVDEELINELYTEYSDSRYHNNKRNAKKLIWKINLSIGKFQRSQKTGKGKSTHQWISKERLSEFPVEKYPFWVEAEVLSFSQTVTTYSGGRGNTARISDVHFKYLTYRIVDRRTGKKYQHHGKHMSKLLTNKDYDIKYSTNPGKFYKKLTKVIGDYEKSSPEQVQKKYKKRESSVAFLKRFGALAFLVGCNAAIVITTILLNI